MHLFPVAHLNWLGVHSRSVFCFVQRTYAQRTYTFLHIYTITLYTYTYNYIEAGSASHTHTLKTFQSETFRRRDSIVGFASFTRAFLYLIDSFCCLLLYHESEEKLRGQRGCHLAVTAYGMDAGELEIIFGSRFYRVQAILYVESNETLVKNNSPYRLMRITMSRAMREKCVVTISVASFCVGIDCSFAGKIHDY